MELPAAMSVCLGVARKWEGLPESDVPAHDHAGIPDAFVAYLRNGARRRELVTCGEVAPLLGIDTSNE